MKYVLVISLLAFMMVIPGCEDTYSFGFPLVYYAHGDAGSDFFGGADFYRPSGLAIVILSVLNVAVIAGMFFFLRSAERRWPEWFMRWRVLYMFIVLYVAFTTFLAYCAWMLWLLSASEIPVLSGIEYVVTLAYYLLLMIPVMLLAAGWSLLVGLLEELAMDKAIGMLDTIFVWDGFLHYYARLTYVVWLGLLFGASFCVQHIVRKFREWRARQK